MFSDARWPAFLLQALGEFVLLCTVQKVCFSLTDELRSLRDEYINASEEGKKFLEKRFGKRVIQKAVEESFSTDWLKSNTKQCPCCGSNIEVSTKHVYYIFSKCTRWVIWVTKAPSWDRLILVWDMVTNEKEEQKQHDVHSWLLNHRSQTLNLHVASERGIEWVLVEIVR